MMSDVVRTRHGVTKNRRDKIRTNNKMRLYIKIGAVFASNDTLARRSNVEAAENMLFTRACDLPQYS